MLWINLTILTGCNDDDENFPESFLLDIYDRISKVRVHVHVQYMYVCMCRLWMYICTLLVHGVESHKTHTNRKTVDL